MTYFNIGMVLIAVGIIGLITVLNCGEWYDDWLGVVSCTLLDIGLIITILCAIDKDTIPTAMDVYRGKATLAITYEDGIPVDSVVVFKERK